MIRKEETTKMKMLLNNHVTQLKKATMNNQGRI